MACQIRITIPPKKRHYRLNRNKNYKYLRGDLSQIVFQKVYYDMPLKYAIEFLMRYMWLLIIESMLSIYFHYINRIY